MKSTSKSLTYFLYLLLIQTLVLFPFKLFSQDTLHAFPSISSDKYALCKGEIATLTIQRFTTAGGNGWGYIMTEDIKSNFSNCTYLGCTVEDNVEPNVTGDGVISKEVIGRKGCNPDPTVQSTIIIKVKPTITTTYRISWIAKSISGADPCLGQPEDIIHVTSYDNTIEIKVVQPTPPVLTPSSITVNQQSTYAGAITATADVFVTNTRAMRWYTSETGSLQQIIPDTYVDPQGNYSSHAINANYPGTYQLFARKIDNGCVSDLSAPATIGIVKYPPDDPNDSTPDPPTTPPSPPVPPNPPPLVISLIDPDKTSLVDNNGNIKTNLSNYKLGDNVIGASTDGVTKILLIAQSQVPVTFTISDSKDGLLSTLDNQNPILYTVTALPNSNGQVVAIYNAPDGYGDDHTSKTERYIIVDAVNTNNEKASILIKLVTPPVVLVHGMWSDPSAWFKGGFTNYLRLRGFTNLYEADYSKYSSYTFDPKSLESIFGRSAVEGKIWEALYTYRNQHLAATQVDIVGHSMGGLMTRSFSQQTEFAANENYYKGYVHKLITLGTPHGGTPLGPELYNSKNEIGFNKGSLNLIDPALLSTVLPLAKMPIGSCHKDFAFRSQGLSNLTATLPYKTFAITANHEGNGGIDEEPFGTAVMEALCLVVFNKPLELVMASRCNALTYLPNDLIVPYKSQTGYIDKTALYYSTSHSFPGKNTETTSPVIQAKVAELLLSNDASDFSTGFPAPNDYPEENCDNQSELVGTNQPLKKEQTSNNLVGSNTPTGNEYLQITSPAKGSIYHQDIDTTVTLSYAPNGGAMPTHALFMIADGGWFTAPVTEPYSVTISLPKNMQAGSLNIVLIARDTTGVLLFDTSHISVLPDGILDSMLVSPSFINLDSTIRQSRFLVQGEYKSVNGAQTIDIGSASAGTVYTTQNNGAVVSVSTDGSVTAVGIGTDTVLVSNNGRTVKVPVTVDSNFLYKTLYPNVIDFADIPDKQYGDDAFALDATATSGENVNFNLISGPVELINGVVIIKGNGAVTIQATCSGDAYFTAAAPVTKTFYIGGVLPLQLLTFTGSLVNNSVLLNWTTANELNLSSYIVERSTDGIHFTDIGTVNAAGSSSDAGNYYFTDQSLDVFAASPIYYRLKETDRDGKQTLSNIIPITLSSVKKIVVYPNPAKRVIHLLLNQPLAGDSYLKLYDMTGKEVMNHKLTNGLSQQIYLPAVNNGNYKVVVWSNGKVVHQQTLFVSM